jgi:Glutamyl-tRNAGlu reductase, dimerisation domain
MSGTRVSQALHERFQEVQRAETDRLKRKLGGLSETDRQCAEVIIAEVIAAIAVASSRRLARDAPPAALEAIVRLFGLDVASGS